MNSLHMPLLLDLTLRAFVVMIVILAASRVFGLRSFSKMSGFDFSVTVALGSVLATALTTPKQSLWIPVAAIVALFIWQMAVSPIRARFRKIERTVDNLPLLLMENGKVLTDNLKRAGMTRDDLWSKLRQANVVKVDEVRIAVFETTGEVTVVYGAGELSPELLENVRRT